MMFVNKLKNFFAAYKGFREVDLIFNVNHPLEDVSGLDKSPYKKGNLFLGSEFIVNSEFIKKNNITSVLTVLLKEERENLKIGEKVKEMGPIKYLHINTFEDMEPRILLNYTTPFIENAMQNDENVLVHCFHGNSRSSTAVVAYMMFKFNLTFEEAYDRLRLRRPVDIWFDFQLQLQQYEEVLKNYQKYANVYI